MPFDQSSISSLSLHQGGGDLTVTWISSSPRGTTFHVYLDHKLVWVGRGRKAVIPAPAAAGNHSVDVGTVDAGETRTDFGPTLSTPSVGAARPRLTWTGGRYLGLALDRFLIYRSAVAGGAVDYSAPVATVAAYPGGIYTDGYGMGGYGSGGYGHTATDYEWIGDPLPSGVWTFAVAACDRAGNRVASPSTVAITITVAPRAPAPNPAGLRATRTYNAGTGKATINWLASPG